MRTFLVAIALGVAMPHAVEASQWPVVVTTDGGRKVEGRLLAITPERLTLSRDGRLEPIPMDTVLRVVKPRDSVLDGLLKGFLIGAVPLLLAGGELDSEYAARYVITFSVIGLGIDAVEGEDFVVYDRAAQPIVPAKVAPMLGWTVRF